MDLVRLAREPEERAGRPAALHHLGTRSLREAVVTQREAGRALWRVREARIMRHVTRWGSSSSLMAPPTRITGSRSARTVGETRTEPRSRGLTVMGLTCVVGDRDRDDVVRGHTVWSPPRKPATPRDNAEWRMLRGMKPDETLWINFPVSSLPGKTSSGGERTRTADFHVANVFMPDFSGLR